MRAVLAAVLAFMVMACSEEPRWHGVDVSGANYGLDWQIVDHRGQPRRLADFRGKVVTLFFGYTHCPDVCPTNLATMKAVRGLLGTEAARLQVIFVTIDPERDTQALLSAYVPAFDPDFIGAYNTPADTARMAREFKVYVNKSSPEGGGDYSVDHSTGTYVYDPQGRLRLYLRHGVPAAEIAADVKRLLAGR